MPKNEELFFRALSTVVDSQKLKAKSIGIPVSSSDIYLDKDYNQYDFKDNIRSMLEGLLREFQSTGFVGTGSLSHHIDGLFVDHFKYGSRIIEFDEEQHFNTFRAASLHLLSSQLEPQYLSHYQECCCNPLYFHRMLRKHRLRMNVKSIPESVPSFIELVQENATPNNGYIEPKAGFNYIAGRIAQRAYYDTLRDVAHLSPRNHLFGAPLRFSIFEFEKKAGCEFSKIPPDELGRLIENRLALLT